MHNRRAEWREVICNGSIAHDCPRVFHALVLREAGLIRVVDKGNMAVAILCRESIEKELPGLTELINYTDKRGEQGSK
ncbi:hypothetical protein GS72_21975 [Salmonella enterica subsp. enterica serovar Give]|nr:hypothetical protein [Salmonella enterica subsp. enterica serovar Give]